MPVSNEDRNVVENMFKAMQAGPEGENAMMALFASDAVFVEPFSGEVKTHQGADAIRTSRSSRRCGFASSWLQRTTTW